MITIQESCGLIMLPASVRDIKRCDYEKNYCYNYTACYFVFV